MVAITKRAYSSIDNARNLRETFYEEEELFQEAEYFEDDDDESKEERESPDDSVVDNAIRQYLGEIGRFPLLTAEQEMTLARRVVEGELEAQQRLVEANLRLVVSIAKRYNNH